MQYRLLSVQDNALSPESRHSNGSAIGMGGSPVVQAFVPYAPRSVPYIMQTPNGARLVSPASATGPPLVAGQQPAAAWVPTSGGAYIIQSPTGPNPIEVFPISSPGEKRCSQFS